MPLKISMPFSRLFFPLIAFLLFGSVAVVLWQNQNRHERELVLRHTETSAEQIRIRIEGMMKSRMASLELLAERWVERTPPDFSRMRFVQFAQTIHDHYPGFKGINWIDPDGVVRWVFPAKSNEPVLDKNVHQHRDSRVRDVFQGVGENLRYAATPCVELYQEGLGFDTFWPLIFAGKVQGYLNGAFQVELIVDTCLARDVLKNFGIRLYEADRLIYTNAKPGDGNPGKDLLRAFREINFPGKSWRLDLVPKTTLYPSISAQNFPLLIFGLTISVILSLLLHFLIQRMQMYRQARDHALHEISERKRVEEALKRNEQKLEALLTVLAAKNAELETFVYSVSHDLKTPIVTIEGFIGALREDFGALITKDGEKYLNYMSDAARKMELLINDLLELSRIGRLTVKKSEVPFADLVREVLKTLQPRIEERGVQVSIAENLPLVYGERKYLAQVMENLLTNAVKYVGKENPSPRIEVGAREQDDQKVFFVRDNGIGIEKIYFDKIFEVFQRLPSAKNISEGTGIGLAIVKRIIENHGGRIWLESEPGKGTTFFFTLKETKD